MQKIILGVEGMMCGMCESHVNDAIRKAVTVKSVSSSHVDKKTEVVASDDVSVDEIKDAIAAQGYTVTSVESVPYEKKSFFARFKK